MLEEILGEYNIIFFTKGPNLNKFLNFAWYTSSTLHIPSHELILELVVVDLLHQEEQTLEEKIIMVDLFMVTKAVSLHLATATEGKIYLNWEKTNICSC